MRRDTLAVRHAPRPVKVFHVLYALRLGGTEAGVVKLVNALDRSRISSAVVSCKPSDALRQRLSDDVQVVEFDRRDGHDLRIVMQLARLFRSRRPDIVHTHSWGTLCEGLLAARLAGVPHLIHGEHGTMDRRPLNLRVQRWAWRRFDRVLSVSSRLADRMARDVGHARREIDVIRNGIDVERFAPGRRAEARHALGLAAEALVIGTVGRLVPVKDQANLLTALARLKAGGLAFQVLIAGDGPLRQTLEAQAAAQGLGASVSFLGARPDVERVLSALDVFALTSESEGLSNTILEAMATGLPVVATNVGGADELVEDGQTGRLVPPKDPVALAAGLGEVIRDSELRARWGAAARDRAEREFSLGRMVAAYETLYVDVAAQPHQVGRDRAVEESRQCAG